MKENQQEETIDIKELILKYKLTLQQAAVQACSHAPLSQQNPPQSLPKIYS